MNSSPKKPTPIPELRALRGIFSLFMDKEVDLSISHVAAMLYVAEYTAENGVGPRIGDIAEETRMLPSTASRMATTLHRFGFMDRLHDEEDGRAFRLALSDQGERVVAGMARFLTGDARKIAKGSVTVTKVPKDFRMQLANMERDIKKMKKAIDDG